MTSRRSIGRFATAVVAATAALLLAATQAFALGATLQRSLYLTNTPTAGASASMSRTIYLAAGNYGWDISTSDAGNSYIDSHGTREIYLAAGTYDWTCTISSPANGYYKNTCSLNMGAGPAYVQSGWFKLPRSGWYSMDSYLTQI
ncbi:hypothetical protein [Streptomyces sp. NPDC051310]|uniref:hypothetical protein n=1 Tax=Streptomyces sp. NPDC051310 TaxID=3365649 RepID=UPI0037980556